MKTNYYRVGGHTYKVNFLDDVNSDVLLPSSDPFKLDAVAEDETLLFEMNVNDGWRPAKRGSEIGQFDCGGNNHGVYQLEDGSYQILVSDYMGHQCCLIEGSADFRSVNVCLNGNYAMRTFGLNNALMMTYAFAGADQKTVLMHASVIRENEDEAYLCLGVSGTGKSTHTSNWLKWVPNTDLMNDDNPVVRVCDDDVVRVYGSPWSGKTPCYRNIQAPVGAFLQLKQAPYNEIARQSVIEGFASLLPSCSVMKWDKRDYVGTCDTVSAILERVPTYFLENLPDLDAVKMSYKAMTGKELEKVNE